ncbi:MAG: glycoside hydrolase family 38 C-terminal domain-containing protein [Acidobacteriaceae bacterium]
MSRIFPVLTFLAVALSSAGGVASAQTADSAAKPDLRKEPTLYVVGYAHLDTEWRWEYPQVIDEYIPNTMHDNFSLFEKYPHYIFNFSGANRYRFMKEYYPTDFAQVQKYVAEGRWFPAGSSVEEGDVNAPSAESIIRQILYGNDWFRKNFDGKYSAEYMLPDCFGFPADLPTILAHSGVKGFSTQKLTWGSSAPGGGPESMEKTPEGTPFNVGVWTGPDGESVVAALNPGSYSGGIYTDLSQPLPSMPPDPMLEKAQQQLSDLRSRIDEGNNAGQLTEDEEKQLTSLRNEIAGLTKVRDDEQLERFQGDWAARVQNNGKVTGIFTDYHYFGTGDIGGSPDENSVRRLEAIVTHGQTSMPPAGYILTRGMKQPEWPPTQVGDGPVHVISATADQMFRDLTPSEIASLPQYTGEMELTNHSAGSLTSEAYQKRWLRHEEVLADAAEKASVAAMWMGGRTYPLERLNQAWTLVMGGQFHDLAAGTATPRAYEFAWNDDVIAMNQFADVLKDATEAVSSSLNTETKGIPVVVYNPLNIEREDLVEADVNFPGNTPDKVTVVDPQGHTVPSQISNGKVIFVARVPSVGYAVYDVQPGGGSGKDTELHVTEHSLENPYYRVQLNSDGDIASIFDKQLHKELLAAPMRLAISYDNPIQWPAWNMDWDQEQAPPREYVGGPAQFRIVEDGPAQVAVQVSRDTAGSHFVQTILLSAGDAGKRVEVSNAIDWNTKESNLKAVFPLTASNRMATYNLGIGTIQRPNAQPRKFEVLSHQWIDLTDASQAFGATILTDAKNGSDKPNDNTIRLTLIRTPGTQGGYPDQGTQDLGHHEFTYGIAGHAEDWRTGGNVWEGLRLNDPLLGFQTTRHPGTLGRDFSLLRVSSPNVRVMALKKAENSNEIVVRLVELDGKPQADVKISFAGPIRSAREINGQEQPVGPATVADGQLETSFTAYQPRTFAVTLGAPAAHIERVHAEPVPLHYDLAASSTNGSSTQGGVDGQGNALPAEMLPEKVAFNGVDFTLGPSGTDHPDAVVARGQTIQLPAGDYNRVYLLATAVGGDQPAEFTLGDHKVKLTIEDWGGFIGQWNDRQWTAREETVPARPGRPARTENNPYGEMTGIKAGYIKRASLAWYSDHHHDASGKNVAYSYSYLFGYTIDLPHGTQSITLPANDKVRILAISVANENPPVTPVQPLYDTLGRSEPSSAVEQP